MASFLAFLQTGTLDGLRVGASESEVLDSLGEPDDTSVIKPPIWKYDQTEITFRDGHIVMLAMYEPLDAEAVKKMLRDARLAYRRNPELTYDDQEAYVLDESGVGLTLDTASPNASAFAT